MKTWYYIFGLLLVISTGSCGENSEAAKVQHSATPVPVKVITLKKANNRSAIQVAGKFTTDDEVYLSFKTGGIIRNIRVEEGDAVHKGQLLATLDMTEINAQVQQAQLSQEKASRDFQRVTNLYQDSVATLEQLQNSETVLKLALRQLEAAQFNQRYSEIRATQNGFVLDKMASVGQVVSPGTPVLQTNGARPGNWLLRVGVSDREWSMIHIGDTVSIITATVTDQPMPGYVLRKSQGVDPKNGSFTIDIKLDKAANEIAVGMFGEAVITTRQDMTDSLQSWSIPYSALLDGDGSTGYVFATHDGKTANKQKVTIAGMKKDEVLISSGLENVEHLVIAGSAYLTDSSRIHITQ